MEHIVLVEMFFRFDGRACGVWKRNLRCWGCSENVPNRPCATVWWCYQPSSWGTPPMTDQHPVPQEHLGTSGEGWERVGLKLGWCRGNVCRTNIYFSFPTVFSSGLVISGTVVVLINPPKTKPSRSLPPARLPPSPRRRRRGRGRSAPSPPGWRLSRPTRTDCGRYRRSRASGSPGRKSRRWRPGNGRPVWRKTGGWWERDVEQRQQMFDYK